MATSGTSSTGPKAFQPYVSPSQSPAEFTLKAVVIGVLSALGAPAFSPIQQAVLYGYRSGLVNLAVRWGWLVLPVGLVAAVLI